MPALSGCCRSGRSYSSRELESAASRSPALPSQRSLLLAESPRCAATDQAFSRHWPAAVEAGRRRTPIVPTVVGEEATDQARRTILDQESVRGALSCTQCD